MTKKEREQQEREAKQKEYQVYIASLNAKSEALKAQEYQCSICFNDGHYTTYLKGDPYMYHYDFLCHCSAAQVAKQYPANREMTEMPMADSWKYIKHFDWISNQLHDLKKAEIFETYKGLSTVPKEKRMDVIKSLMNKDQDYLKDPNIDDAKQKIAEYLSLQK